MRHLSIVEHGASLGFISNRLVVRNQGDTILETPLSRLRSISIAKKGVSISSNLLLACAARGVRVFLLDWRQVAVAAVSGRHQHAVVALRAAQFQFIESIAIRDLCRRIVNTKIRNQRAVLLYFSKYLRQQYPERAEPVVACAEFLAEKGKQVQSLRVEHLDQWRDQLMGYEGACAASYWQALRDGQLFPETFKRRDGRGSSEVVNQALNYGYTLLMSYQWSALDNAGFELYAGFFHQERAGRASLVLDIMEEYRPWVVDRNVINIKKDLEKSDRLTLPLKKRVAEAIHSTMSRPYLYKGKRLRLESIIQRQAYVLASTVMTGKPYKGYRFKW